MEVKKRSKSFPLNQQQYILSLGHLRVASHKKVQVEFLDNSTADGLVSRMLQEKVPQQIVKNYLKKFHLDKELNELVLKTYIKQFYIHSAQDLRTKPDLYLESILQLTYDTEEQNNLFNYILGFEILKMIFQMSWLQQERLYRLQKNQEYFIKNYIKPIQFTHKINGLVVPKHEKIFFAKRNYFIKEPKIKEKKLIELVMATFTTDTVTHLGFLTIRHLNFLVFDYDYIFDSEPECLFLL